MGHILLIAFNKFFRILCLLLYACLHWTSAYGNPTANENTQLGSIGWALLKPALNGEIEGYASQTSVNQGGSIDLHVRTSAPSFNVQIYRMGYYGGAGGRLMQTIGNVARQAQTTPCLNAAGVVECNWATSATINVPAASSTGAWVSGVYLAKLTTNDAANYQSYILFVVRDDARTAEFVAQLPVSTYQAYNFWGGQSLYTGCLDHDSGWQCGNGAQRAHRVSFNRPYGPSRNPAASFGVGAGEFITNVQPVMQGYPISSAGVDYNLVRWMERDGHDVKYVTNIDLHQDSGRLIGAKGVILMGHDEYYSKAMRDNLTMLRDDGVNLGFFTSNEIYWKARFEPASGPAGIPDRTMAVYKNGADPVSDYAATTGRFRDLGWPEASLVGSQYVKDPVQGPIVVSDPFHWLYSGSGATANSVLPGLLGYEINARIDGVSPANTVVLARSPAGGEFGDITFYLAPSSAQVFATGSMQWAWGLDDFISNGTRGNFVSPIAQKVTSNVFAALGERELVAFINKSTGMYLHGTGTSAATRQLPGTTGLAKSDAWRLVDSDEAGQFLIVSRAHGSCLDAYGAVAGSEAGTWKCNGTGQQKWRLVDKGGVHVALVDKRSGLCMQSPAPGAAEPVPVMAACAEDERQKWTRAVWRGPATPAPAGILPGTNVTITSALGPYLVGTASVQSGPVLQTPDGGASGAVQWMTAASGDGSFLRLLAVSSGLCLDAYGTGSGATVGTWDCHGGANQDWLFTPFSNNLFQLRNRGSSQCMTIAGASPSGGNGIMLTSCAAVTGQHWQVAYAAALESTFGLQNKNGLFAAISAGGAPAGRLVLAPAAFRWNQGPTLDAAYSRISAVSSGLCLDAYGSAPGAGAGTWSCHGGDNQQWSQQAASGGYVQLADKRSRLCLAAPAGSSVAGAELVLAVCAASDSQLWRTTTP